MDKINIRDLRVGNWLSVHHPTMPAENIQISADWIRTIERINDGLIKEDSPLFRIVEPIPITSDICDQVNDGHVILLWDDKKYEETGESWYELDICDIPDKTVCINIQYVHQLQNILQDLGIEKEITI